MPVLTDETIAQIRRMRYEDGLTCVEVAAAFGLNRMTIGKYAPGRPGKVSNALVREMFLASDVSAYQVARHIGWLHSDGHPDSCRVKRTLGISYDCNNGKRNKRKMIDAEVAETISEALGHERWEAIPEYMYSTGGVIS